MFSWIFNIGYIVWAVLAYLKITITTATETANNEQAQNGKKICYEPNLSKTYISEGMTAIDHNYQIMILI